jgi:hypothetical protein
MPRSLECTFFGFGIYASTHRNESGKPVHTWTDEKTGETIQRRFARRPGLGTYLFRTRRWDLELDIGRIFKSHAITFALSGVGFAIGNVNEVAQ